MKGAGATGYDYEKWSIVTPLGYTKNSDSGSMDPTIGYRYKEANGISREHVVASFSGVGVAGSGGGYSIATHGSDVMTCGMLAHHAFHGTCANNIILQRPTP